MASEPIYSLAGKRVWVAGHRGMVGSAPLKRQTRARVSWPARFDALRQPWSASFLPIDHVYTGPGWRLTRLTRLRIAGSDHFATEAAFTRR